MTRCLIIIALLILILIPFALYDFEHKELLKYFKANMECLFLWLASIAALILALFSKEKQKQLGLLCNDEVKGLPENIKKQIVLPENKTVSTIDDIKKVTNDKLKSKFSELFESLKKGKHELVIANVQNKLKKAINEKEKFIYYFILYIAYMTSDNDKYMDDIIETIKNFIPLAKKYERNSSFKHIELQLNLVIAYMKKGSFEEAHHENLKIIQEIQYNSKIPAPLKCRCYQLLAVYYLKNNNIIYAMGYFEKSSQYEEDNYETLFNMALIYYAEEKNIDKCLECIAKIDRTTIKDQEQFRILILMQYYCLSLKNQYDEAYDILCNYEVSAGYLPTGMKGHKAYIAYKLGKYEEARHLSDEILSKEYDVTAMNVRAILQIQNKQYKEAIVNFTKIIPEFDENSETCFLGEIYYHRSFANIKLKKPKEAFDDFIKAKDLGFTDFSPEYIIEIDLSQIELNKE